jgi:hypothetical protein
VLPYPKYPEFDNHMRGSMVTQSSAATLVNNTPRFTETQTSSAASGYPETQPPRIEGLMNPPLPPFLAFSNLEFSLPWCNSLSCCTHDAHQGLSSGGKVHLLPPIKSTWLISMNSQWELITRCVNLMLVSSF